MAVDLKPGVTSRPGHTKVPPEETPVRRHLGNAYRILTERPLSLYAAAFLRIGYGLLYLILLVREFPNRDRIWGPDSPWTVALARQDFAQSRTGWSALLTLSDSRQYFEACYVVAMVVALLFMLGWRTRVMSILFAIVVVSFYSRNLMVCDGGDNLMILMAVYLTLTACGRRWSLDARRSRAAAEKERPAAAGILRRFTVTVLHNCAMLVIMAQMCILYGAAGLYKVQGNLWDDGTALHYVLKQDLFRPWPALSDFVDGQHLMIAVAAYLTVLVQIAFPFSLFSKLKYAVLVILIGMHLGIAILLGLPLFSAVMIVGDAVFLPDGLYLFLARTARRALRRGTALKTA
jgi:hypothetical protein